MPDHGTVIASKGAQVVPIPAKRELVPLGCLSEVKYRKARPGACMCWYE